MLGSIGIGPSPIIVGTGLGVMAAMVVLLTGRKNMVSTPLWAGQLVAWKIIACLFAPIMIVVRFVLSIAGTK
jgi:hypothetical protein